MANTILGKVCITPKGEYNPETAYEYLDAVSYEGRTYLALKGSQGVTPAVGEYYVLLSDTGAKGDKGDTPVKGVDYYTEEDKTELETELQGYIDENTVGKKTAEGAEIFNDYTNNVATGKKSHAEGGNTQATGYNSHAEGDNTQATSGCTHAEGSDTQATGAFSHAEGTYSKTSGWRSHVEGSWNDCKSNDCHVEGSNSGTGLSAKCSHVEGYYCLAYSPYQHVQGKYNATDSNSKYAHIVGGGTSDSDRKNIHTVDWDGNAFYLGTVECAGVIMTSPNGTKYKITVDNSGNLVTATV